MRTLSQTLRCVGRVIGAGLSLTGLLIPVADAADTAFGRRPSAAEISSVDIDVKPNGSGLPAGSGTAVSGAKVYAAQCVACHGSTGTEGPRDRLVGGQGSLATAEPIKTVGSYWQYAPTLYDYINRAMPFTAPGSLKPDEVYSLVAFLLNRNGIVGENDVIDQASLPQVKMPNRDGFVVEPQFRNVTRK